MEVRSDRLVRIALRIWTTIGALLLLAATWVLLRDPISLIGPPLAIAAVVVYFLNPAVSWFERRSVPRPLGTLLAYLVALTSAWLVLSQLGPVLAEQGRGLLDELPAIGQSLQEWINRQLVSFGAPASTRVDLQPDTLTEQVRAFLSTNTDQIGGLLRGAGSVVSWVVHLAIAVTLGPILAFYALSDLPRLGAGARRLLPPDRRPEVVEVTSRIGRIVGSYFRGQVLVATFVGTATAVGLAVIGLPFWAVVGLTTGVFNLVPLVGPTAGAVFGVLLALTVGGGVRQALLVILVMVVVQQIDNHLITPMVVARSVAIHPITVIVALIVAGSIGGIPLMFVAIPMVAVLKLVLLHVVVTRLPSMAHVADDPEDDGPARKGTVANLAQELRRSFEWRLAAAQAATSRGRGRDESELRTQHPSTRPHDDPTGGARPTADDPASADGGETPVSRPTAGAPPT